ncbi:IS66 family insertion sequence element accessory protein TnpB [Massilia sp. YIM B04103]|uniref:IS66 family insertion sequence element accessory protein TnpB n=1 Tax=Massilia sp. YIM B04103 TaxID=2963106 RepID=UPI0035A6D9AA
MQLQANAVWLETQPVDIRAGIDRLSLHVQQALGRAPCDGAAYVFSNRRHTWLKVVCWDGNGVWMCLRHWPAPS